jgi:hypothetical protein
MTNLYEALEICLREIERGASIETALLRYPDLADELRPILEASVDAANIAVPLPSETVIQRNRAKVLQRAAQIREAKAKSTQRIWFVSLRRLAVMLAVLIVLSVSGTGLVRASSATVPGDNLYPVKRTWEDVLVAFTFNVQQRDALEVEHENERLQELQDLFAEGRSAKVDFNGSIKSQNGNLWVVSNISVMISDQTELRGQGISVGSAVRVKGTTQGNNNVVLAERIELLSAGAKLPDTDDEPDIQQEKHQDPLQQFEDNSNSGKGSEGETQTVEETKTAESEPENKNESVEDGSNNTNTESGRDSNSNDSYDNESNDNSGSNSNDYSSSYNSNDSSGGESSNDSSGAGGGGGDD